MDKIQENICDFLDYAEAVEGLGGKWKERAVDKAKEFSSKPRYMEVIRQMDYEHKSLLNTAISRGLEFLPRLLLDYLGANPRSPGIDPTGRTSMHYVCEAGHMMLFEEFTFRKYHRVEYNGKDTTGLIPLHLAILNGHTKIACKMLERIGGVGVVENHDLFFGRSIHAAAYMKQLCVIQRIYEKFPEEVSIVISGFCTPHVCALYGDSIRCLTYLCLASPVMPGKILSKAVAYAESEETALAKVLILLHNGADPDDFDEDLCEEPAVIVAAKKKWEKFLEF